VVQVTDERIPVPLPAKIKTKAKSNPKDFAVKKRGLIEEP